MQWNKNEERRIYKLGDFKYLACTRTVCWNIVILLQKCQLFGLFQGQISFPVQRFYYTCDHAHKKGHSPEVFEQQQFRQDIARLSAVFPGHRCLLFMLGTIIIYCIAAMKSWTLVVNVSYHVCLLNVAHSTYAQTTSLMQSQLYEIACLYRLT